MQRGAWSWILKVLQKWNIPTNRAQRVDEKNGIICLVIVFTPRVMVIKMSKMALVLYFLQMTGKNQSQFGQNTCIWKIFVALSENTIEFRDFVADSAVFSYFYPWYLTNGNSKAILFSDRTQKDLSGALKCFSQNFALCSGL